MGDFNINLLGVEKCNQYARIFLLSLQSFSLFRQLTKPTRFHNNSATLIIYIETILLNGFDYNITSGNIDSDVSDHYSPFCWILHSREWNTNVKPKTKKRDFSTGADPRILEFFVFLFLFILFIHVIILFYFIYFILLFFFFGGGGSKFWFKKDRWTYLFVNLWTPVAVVAGACFASRGEQIKSSQVKSIFI